MRRSSSRSTSLPSRTPDRSPAPEADIADYSFLTPDAGRAIGRRYGLDLTTIEPLVGGMTNSSFRAGDGTARFIITVLDDHDVASATALAELMAFLAAADLATPTPLLTAAGKAITTWQDKPVMVKPFIDGTLEHPLGAQHLPGVGAFLARLHLLAPPTSISARGRELPPDWRDQLPSPANDELIAVVAAAERGAEQWRDLPSGLIHGDLFDDNIIVAPDDELIVLDWETATIEPLVLDLGLAAVGLCRIDNRLDQERLDTLVAGYQTVRPLSPDELDALPATIASATALLAFNRYVRHNVDRPDDRKEHLYRELLAFAATLGPS